MGAVNDTLWFGCKYRRSQLSISDQKIYDELFNGLKNCKKNIALPKNSSKYYSWLLSEVTNDNPLLFHVEKYTMASSFSGVIIQPRFRLHPDRYMIAVQEVEKDIYTLVKSFDRSNTWNTVDAIHSFVLDNIKYSDYGVDAHTVMGVVSKRAAVCEGISKFVKLLCDALCIKCVVVSGKAATPGNTPKILVQNNHAWNAIQIAGDWFYFDFTFDLSLSVCAPSGRINRYDYYALDANSISIDHFDPDVLVAPTGNNHDYFTQKKLVVRNQLELNNIVLRETARKNSALLFKVSTHWCDFNADRAISTILKLPQINALCNGGNGVIYSYNEAQRVCFMMVNSK